MSNPKLQYLQDIGQWREFQESGEEEVSVRAQCGLCDRGQRPPTMLMTHVNGYLQMKMKDSRVKCVCDSPGHTTPSTRTPFFFFLAFFFLDLLCLFPWVFGFSIK